MTHALPTRLRLFAAAALALAAACSGEPSSTGVDRLVPPAQLALDATVRFQTTGSAALRVNTSYQRTNQSLVPLDTQTVSLTDAASQQVPLTIDLSPCLRDPQRALAGGDAAASDACLVTMELALITNGQVVDRDTVRSLSMRPGRTSTVSNPITLEEVASLRLTPPAANVVGAGQPLRLEATRTLTIGAEVIDGANRPIPRPITWTSASNAVATVSATGVVTGVAPGTTRITATSAGRSAFVDVRVTPLPQVVTVTVGTGSSGTGTITSSPAGINCTVAGSTTSGSCSASFPGDTTVSLTQSTGSGATFVGWGGDCAGTAECRVVTSQPRTVSVTYRAFRTLTVAATGDGNGTITGLDGAIDCVWRFGSASSGPCTTQVPDGAEVTLTATAESGSQFVGWSSGCAVNGTSCTVTMNADRSVTAQFRPLTTYRIASGLGTGTGVVTSSPAGLDCTITGRSISGTCAITVPGGTNVSFIATATDGSTWRRWDGLCANADATCATTAPLLPGTVELGVEFEAEPVRPPVVLTVTVDGRSSGVGEIVGSDQLNCFVNGTTTSAPCRKEYPAGTTVTITANRVGLTDFAGWGGACAQAAGNSCTLTLTEDQTATVRFQLVPSTRLRIFGYSTGGVSIQVRHAYGSQRCAITEGPDNEGVTCTITVPLRQDITITPTIPANWVIQYYGLCENQSFTRLSCVTQLDGPRDMTVYAFSGSPGPQVDLKRPPLRKGN